ncbi:hypothetical protein CPB86DRAFT_176028 [Serendipita vermifera]|nr:hypothetical protein CPB86DRAFT_176028 [Serendipita vermifera]
MVQSIEQKHADTGLRKFVQRWMSPIVTAMMDYNDIINTLTSGDPMPCAIIWGSLKVVLSSINRYHNFFEKIKRTLTQLRNQIDRIKDYEDLYGDNPTLQDLLCRTYIDIIRFWARVFKECERCALNQMLRASVPFSTSKLNAIVDDIKASVEDMEKQTTIVEASLARNEREEALLERKAQTKEREEQNKFRQEQREDRHAECLERVRNWLGSFDANQYNYSRHEKNLSLHMKGTGKWLESENKYAEWRTGSSSPILWIRSFPGSGKSVLCSSVIASIQESAAVVFYFYAFDRDSKPVETLRLLAHQLLRIRRISPGDKIVKELDNMTHLEPCSQINIQNMIKNLVTGLPQVYFFLDGLDESHEGDVLQFLIDLALSHPKEIRLWCSSQDTMPIHEKLSQYPTIEIDKSVEQDITAYLTHNMPLPESFADQVPTLAKHAKCNFLWASLMMKHLKESANSPADMHEVMKTGLPDNLYDYYRGVFDRIDKKQRVISSLIFSLVCFAKRPLRLEELREALGMLQSKDPSILTESDLPFMDRLKNLLAPLVEVMEVQGPYHTDRFCRLFHSTVRDFLIENPGVLCTHLDNKSSSYNEHVCELHINPSIPANACIRYLSQSRYGELLTEDKDHYWIDSTGSTVHSHHLLLYAAKYWDRHLDDVVPNGDLEARVSSFILSPNFRTCLQIQSMWIDGHFCVFQLPGSDDKFQFLRRTFPRWLVTNTQIGRQLWYDYRDFLHEWKDFLNCQKCDDSYDRPTRACLGDVNRCWWSALGPSNFLSRFGGRYLSFIFQPQDKPIKSAKGIFEGISQCGRTLVNLRFECIPDLNQDVFEVLCESWSITGRNEPTLRHQQTIQTGHNATCWPIYMGKESSPGTIVAPVAIDDFCETLRIGSQIFKKDISGNFLPIYDIPLSEGNGGCLPYIEEWSLRDNILVVSSRTRVYKPEGTKENTPETPVSTSDESESDSDHISSDTGSDEEDDAYESWSEGSTVYSDPGEDQYDDDQAAPFWFGRLSDGSKSDFEYPLSDEENSGCPPYASSDGSDADSDVESDAIRGYRELLDEDDFDWKDLRDQYPEDPGSKAKNKDKSKSDNESKYETHASISILDTSSSPTSRVFHLTRSISFKLYDSPPVIHPFKPLMVWPLSGGDVVFIDSSQKTYFVRRLRPTTFHTRHIFMKCRFSPCGRYLHIAGLEAQKKPESHKRGKGDSQNKTEIKLSVLVSTYRLSARKTARSPPTLIHRVKAYLGTTSLLRVSKLPFTLIWRPEELYIVRGDATLNVYRVQLFPGKSTGNTEGTQEVLTPRKPIFLPASARYRRVYYFPSDKGAANDNALGCIIVGGEARTKQTISEMMEFESDKRPDPKEGVTIGHAYDLQNDAVPPIGCYVHERELGGWRRTSERADIPKYMGAGCLSHRLEKFNPQDDCDLEPYFY